MILQVEDNVSPVTPPSSIWTLDLQLLNLAIQHLVKGVLQVCLVRSTSLVPLRAGFAVESLATH